MSFVYRETGGLGFYEVTGWDGAKAVFTTRKGGVSQPPYDSLNLGAGSGDEPALVMKNRALLAVSLGIDVGALKTVNQVHGTDVCMVDGSGATRPEAGCDAIITNTPGAAISILTADCVPILIYDPVTRCAASVHAGWAGTVKCITANAVRRMVAEFGASPKDIKAAVGPSIGPCCYEVDEKVVAPLRAEFSDCSGLAEAVSPGHWHLDLWETNRRTLVKAGVLPSNITVMGLCTACNEDKFFSHRKSGGKAGRMMGIVILGG